MRAQRIISLVQRILVNKIFIKNVFGDWTSCLSLGHALSIQPQNVNGRRSKEDEVINTRKTEGDLVRGCFQAPR